MNSIERMRNVLKGKFPDKVPFFPTIFTDHAAYACGRNFEEVLINPSTGPELMLKAALKYNTDCVRFPICPDKAWYKEKEVKLHQGKLVQFDRKSNHAEGYFDVEGGGKFIKAVPEPPIRAIEEVEKIKVLTAAEYLENGCLEEIRKQIEKAHDYGLFTVGMCSGQTLNFMVDKMGNAEDVLMCFYDNPELAHALIKKGVETSIEKAKAFINVGIDCIYIGDSFASASVISPEIYEKFCFPAYKKTASFIKSQGVFCYKHCCGNYNPLLESLPATGIDAMDGIDPTQGMSVKKTKDVIGDKMTLMGGLSCLTLLQCTPAQVYKEAEECIRNGKPGGRYVLGSACAVPRFTPPKNMNAAFQAVQDFGYYLL